MSQVKSFHVIILTYYIIITTHYVVIMTYCLIILIKGAIMAYASYSVLHNL